MPLAGRRLSYLEAARLAHKHGIPLGEKLATAVAVCEWESRRYAGAWNFNSRTKDQSYGLWQINLLGKLKAERMTRYGLNKPEDLYQPDVNARVMASISSKGANWKPWGAYTNGNYKKALPEARRAVAQLKAELAKKKPAAKPVTLPGQVKPATPKPKAEVRTVAGVEAMVARAEKDLGLGEPNYIQDWYRARNGSAYGGNFAWCNAAVTKWAYDSGNHSTVCIGSDYAYTVAHADRFRQNGRWYYGASGIRRGDIVFFDWNGTNSIGAIDHVGIVTSVSGGTVYTIEGNIGNVCARKVRYENTIAGYGRPAYVVDDSPTLPPVDLSVVQYALTHPAADEPTSGRDDVDLMQKGLVQVGKLAAGTFAPGMGDQPTKDAYAAWQRSLGYAGADADGVPGITSLTKLGSVTGLFRVVS